MFDLKIEGKEKKCIGFHNKEDIFYTQKNWKLHERKETTHPLYTFQSSAKTGK